MLKNQDAGKVLSSSVPKSQLTMVDGFGGALPARYTGDKGDKGDRGYQGEQGDKSYQGN